MMPKFHIVIVIAVWVTGMMISCNKPTGRIDLNAPIIKSDSCQNNTKHTYEVYISATEKSNIKLPLLVVIDPHGSGKYALAQFKEAVTKYAAVMVSSNLVKNNYGGYLNSLEEMVQDVKSKYHVGNTIYLAGFSGGARMAIGYALKHPVNGVIACGALAKPEQIKAVNCPIYAITGMDDFNFIESAQFVLNPSKIPSNLLIEVTNASHAWPEKEILTNVWGYFSLSHPLPGMEHETKSLTKDYIRQQKSLIDSLLNNAEILQATLLSRNLSLIPVFEQKGRFNSIYLQLMNEPEFANQREELSKSIQFELKVREAYFNALQQKDTLWWNREINSLMQKLNSEKNLFSRMAYQRIKGFLGIMCYSLSNRYLSSKDLINMEKILSVYRLLEPENPDLFFFSAVDAKWRGENEKANLYLNKAKQEGYSDIDKVKQYFSEYEEDLFLN